MKPNQVRPVKIAAALLALTVLLANGNTQPAAAPVSEAPKPAGGAIRWDAQPTGSSTKIEGTSTVHDWTMESKILGGYIEADEKFPESALTDAKAARPAITAFMPVKSFKSYATKMDTTMQEAMNESTHKFIRYTNIDLKPKSAAGSTGPLQFDATGTITVNGTTRTNTMPVVIEKKDGKLKVTGNTALKMTDFGVKPPAPSFLPIKTGDDIKINFEWQLAPKSK